jgi:hypothetical protein
LIDDLMVSALFLLVVGLSLPTIMQLADSLRANRPLPNRALLVRNDRGVQGDASVTLAQ